MAESLQDFLSRHRAAAWDCAQPVMRQPVEVFRVEVWRDGVLLEGRTFPNLHAAQVFAGHQRTRGDTYRALVMYPRAETP